MPTAMPLEDLLEQLHAPDDRMRERAVRRLLPPRPGRVHARAGHARPQGVVAAVPAPPRSGPTTRPSISSAPPFHVPLPEYLPHVVERYPHWSRRARAEALRLLMRIEDRRAAEAVMTIVRRHARVGDVPRLPTGLYAHAPQHADVFFPELLDYLDVPKLAFSICALALSFAGAHQLEPGVLVPGGRHGPGAVRDAAGQAVAGPADDGVAWRWRPRYHRRRWQAGVLLDLLGHTPTPAVEAELRRAVGEFTDPRLRLYAILSLLRHDREVDPAVVAEIAADPESRKWLFDGLQKLERTHLYPAEYRTQAALAESDLVNWLIHPTELGRAPEEIELVQAVPFDTATDAGWADYYLFRFRTEPPHWAARYGWLAGVAGPFLRKDQPTIQALGDTFSAFTPWDRNRRRSTSRTCAS